MKRITQYLILAIAAALTLGSCGPEMNEVVVNNAPTVEGTKLSPMTDVEGNVKAYIGTEVTVPGHNLENVSRVTLADTQAEITSREIRQLKFKVPALALAQQDTPHELMLTIYGEDGSTTVSTAPYYITVPVTDAIVTEFEPKEGSVGTEITLSGRNLEQLTRVVFGGVTVEAEAFTQVVEGSTGSCVKFLVPAGDYAAADSEQTITAEWGTSTIDVTEAEKFLLHVPVIDPLTAQADGVNSILGEEITLTGENLDLVTAYKWGDNELTVVEGATPESVTLRIPLSIELADPAVQTKDITAEWGTPTQAITLAEAWRVDTTPLVTIIIPELNAFTAEDGGADNKLYLGKTVTVSGVNLTAVEGIELRTADKSYVAQVVEGSATDGEVKFIVPEVDFQEAQEVSIFAIYNSGDSVECAAKATVYPFYYFKGIRLGIGSNSKSTYKDYAYENSFFYPDMGRVVSTTEWMETKFDSYAASGSNSAVKSANTLNKDAITADEYYAVKPYVFFITNSSHKLSLAGCANSASQIKTHCVKDDEGKFTSLPSTFGTPIVQYRVVTGEDAATIKEGSHTTMTYAGSSMPSAGAPALSTEEGSSAWVKGSVLVMAYVNYAKGAKPEAVTDFARTGYIVIRDITCADLTTGKANADRDGYIEFDMYWSTFQNK